MKKPGKHIFGIPTVVARVPTDSQPATVVRFLHLQCCTYTGRRRSNRAVGAKVYGSNPTVRIPTCCSAHWFRTASTAPPLRLSLRNVQNNAAHARGSGVRRAAAGRIHGRREGAPTDGRLQNTGEENCQTPQQHVATKDIHRERRLLLPVRCAPRSARAPTPTCGAVLRAVIFTTTAFASSALRRRATQSGAVRAPKILPRCDSRPTRRKPRREQTRLQLSGGVTDRVHGQVPRGHRDGVSAVRLHQIWCASNTSQQSWPPATSRDVHTHHATSRLRSPSQTPSYKKRRRCTQIRGRNAI